MFAEQIFYTWIIFFLFSQKQTQKNDFTTQKLLQLEDKKRAFFLT